MHFLPLFLCLNKKVLNFFLFLTLSIVSTPTYSYGRVSIQNTDKQFANSLRFCFILPEAPDCISYCYYIFSRVQICSVVLDHSLYI